MDARSLPEAFKLIMKDRSWTQADLAEALGRSKSFVSRVMSGQADPGVSKTAGLLARVDWEVRITPKTEDDDPVKRRAFLASVGAITFVPSTKVGPYQDSAYVRELSGRLCRDLFEQGGVSLMPVAARHARNVESVITSTDRELQAAASDLMRWVTAVMSDARQFRAGEQAGAVALRLARAAGNRDAEACAQSALTELNVDRGNADRAVMHAQAGVVLRDIPDAQRAWLNVRLAQSLAQIDGQEQAARRALNDAQTFLADVQEHGGLPTLEAADLSGEIGIALASLRKHEDAYVTLDDAVRLSEQSSPFLQGCYLGRQIEATLRNSQPSEAAVLMGSLARVVPVVASARLDRHVQTSLVMSTRWARVPEVRQARDQLRVMLPPSRTASK